MDIGYEAKFAVLEFAMMISHGSIEYREWLNNSAMSYVYGEMISPPPAKEG